ncbi:MAG: M14 family zinc carboxypeptidase, partial [Chloroflexia bacterium]
APQTPFPVSPELYPFSDRYPALVVCWSWQQWLALQRTGAQIDSVRPLFPGRPLPSPGGPFAPVRVEVVVGPKDVERLQAAGLTVEPIPNVGLRAHRAYGPGSGAPNAWPTYEQFVARMQGIASNYPSIARIFPIGQSVQGRTLWVLKISDKPDQEEDEPEFRYLANMHGDETVGIEMTIRLAELLVSGYGSDPRLTTLVDEAEIWLLPIYNPDGYVAGSRYNAHGVDLNRDYPDRFTDPVDDPAGREPETQAAMLWGHAHRFVMGANYHGGALVVNFPWDAVAPPGAPIVPDYAPDDAIFYDFSVGYATRNPMIWNGGFPNGVTRGWEWYQIWGGLQDWAYHWGSEHHVTIEISSNKMPPYEQMDLYWDANREAMLWWMERALTGARGLVTDAATGAPLDATVDVVQIGKPVRTDPEIGDYHRLLLPGSYTLMASAYCHFPAAASVVVPSGDAVRQNFALEPAPTWTVQGTVTEAGTGRPLAATVAFLDTPVVVQTDPATGHYQAGLCEGVYTMRVSAPQHRAQERLITVTGDLVEDFALERTPCTLLVDDDLGEDYETYYAAALEALGQAYDVWDVSSQGSPDVATLASYGRVIWLTGDDYNSTLTGADQAALAAYLDGGGRLFLSGQDIGYDIGGTPFYTNYLHAVYDSDDTNNYTLTGMGYLAGVDLYIQGGDGANNQAYPSDISPTGGAVAVLDYPSPHLYGGVAYQDETYRVVYFSFGYEAIDNAPDRIEVMSRTLAFLEGCPAYEVALTPSELIGAPGEVVTHTFMLANLGTQADRYTLTLTPGAWPAALLDPTVGPLQPLEGAPVRVQVEIPYLPLTATVLLSDVLVVRATSQGDPDAWAEAPGTTYGVADLSLAFVPDECAQAGPGGRTLLYRLALTNTGGYTDSYALSLAGNFWETAVVPTRTPPLAPGEMTAVWVSVRVPYGPAGESDTVTVRAASGWTPLVRREVVLRSLRLGQIYLPLVRRGVQTRPGGT